MDEQKESGDTIEENRELPSSESPEGGDNPIESSQDLPRQPISMQGAEPPGPSSLQQQLDELNKHIEEAIEKKFQSGKDKRMVRLEREIKALNEELEELRKKHELGELASPSASARNGEADEAAAAGVSPHAPSFLHSARASHVIQPSGGGLPAPDLRGEYEKRLAALRPGDVAGLMEVKREFRKRGLEVY